MRRGIGMARAGEDQSAPIPEKITSKLGRSMHKWGSTDPPKKNRMALLRALGF
jgi:hypothetical protein